MKHLFVTILLSFLASLLVFIAILSSTFFYGYRRSVAGWGAEMRKDTEEEVYSILTDIFQQEKSPDHALFLEKLSPLLPHNILLSVYNADKELLFTRGRQPGMGRMRAEKMGKGEMIKTPLTPVKVKGEIKGYYRIGPFGFGIDRASKKFLDSMRKTVWISVLFAFLLALIASLFFSNRFSLAAKKVASGIDRMAQGELSVRIPEEGVEEISLIARSANELGEKLEREESLRRQWAADVAHDLRTPISALKSQLEGIVDGVLDLSKQRVVKNIQELERIETLVDNLGEITRLESPEMKILRQKIDSAQFFQELESRFSQLFKKKSISVHWSMDVDTIEGDEALLLRAISNFISNAIRHTPENGEIRVSVSGIEGGFLFSVFNSGIRIPEAEIDKVFERLYRGEYARHTPGSGLGLTIARKIAELHGGTVAINSTEKEGTVFEMKIRT